MCSYELKEEIDEDNSPYANEIIRRRQVINLENYEDDDEDKLEVENTYPWLIKTIKCGLCKMSFEIMMIRYSVPRSIELRRTSLRRSITNPFKDFAWITRCMLNFRIQLPFFGGYYMHVT